MYTVEPLVIEMRRKVTAVCPVVQFISGVFEHSMLCIIMGLYGS